MEENKKFPKYSIKKIDANSTRKRNVHKKNSNSKKKILKNLIESKKGK